MNETTKDALSSLASRMGLNLLDTLPAGAKPEVQHLIQAAQKRLLDRVLLLSLIPKRICSKNAGSEVEEIVGPYAPGKPGFSNRATTSDKLPCADTVTATMAGLNVVAATIYEEQVRDENYMRYIINEEVAPNVAGFWEDQLINGDGNKNRIAGLLHDDHDTITIESKSEPTQIDFSPRTLEEYGRKAGRTPSLIILPDNEMVRLAELQLGQDAQGFPRSLFGIPVTPSGFLLDERGLIVAVDEIVLAASSPKLKFEPRDHEQIEIIVSCNLGLLIKRPGTIAKLDL